MHVDVSPNAIFIDEAGLAFMNNASHRNSIVAENRSNSASIATRLSLKLIDIFKLAVFGAAPTPECTSADASQVFLRRIREHFRPMLTANFAPQGGLS